MERREVLAAGLAVLLAATMVLAEGHAFAGDERADVKETSLDAHGGLNIKVRIEGPDTADAPLQIVCYFKYTPEGAKRMSGAPIELDKKLGGAIASLRERAEFAGDEGETLLIHTPKNSIKAEALLLVGLGDESALSLDTMERVGRLCLRESARLGVNRVAFAPLIRDQGNSTYAAGDTAGAVLKGLLLAYDTEKRQQKEGLAKEYTLKEWMLEAGPKYFEETVSGAKKAIEEAIAAAAKRPSETYRKK
jgi:leucyl aminopeptidase